MLGSWVLTIAGTALALSGQVAAVGSYKLVNNCAFDIYFYAVQKKAGPTHTLKAKSTLPRGTWAPQYCPNGGDKPCTGMVLKLSTVKGSSNILQAEYAWSQSDESAYPNKNSYDFSSVNGDGGLLNVQRTWTPDSISGKCQTISCSPGQTCGFSAPTTGDVFNCDPSVGATISFC